jgi:hypothetical protein
MGTVPDHMKLIDLAGSCSLTFECGDRPADVAVFAAGHVPNGYFWEGSFSTSPEGCYRR